MNTLKAKLKDRKGFTLIEMLIVVAIIAILVVVAVPAVSSSLDKSNKAADDANERSAKSVAMISMMSEDFDKSNIYFDAASGQMTNSKPKGYGKSRDHKDEVVKVTYPAKDGDPVTTEWVPI